MIHAIKPQTRVKRSEKRLASSILPNSLAPKFCPIKRMRTNESDIDPIIASASIRAPTPNAVTVESPRSAAIRVIIAFEMWKRSCVSVAGMPI